MTAGDSERIVRLETKVDSIQSELTEFKDAMHKDFGEHKAEDVKNFTAINRSLAANTTSIAELKTLLKTAGVIWGVIIGIVSIIGTLVSIFK